MAFGILDVWQGQKLPLYSLFTNIIETASNFDFLFRLPSTEATYKLRNFLLSRLEQKCFSVFVINYQCREEKKAIFSIFSSFLKFRDLVWNLDPLRSWVPVFQFFWGPTKVSLMFWVPIFRFFCYSIWVPGPGFPVFLWSH